MAAEEEKETSLAEYATTHNHWSAHQILSFLWLGDSFSAANARGLREHHISHVLVASGDDSVECWYNETIKYFRIFVHDSDEEDLIAHLPACHAFLALCDPDPPAGLQGADHAKGAVLVHCLAGISRSVTVVVSYLMRRSGQVDVEKAISEVSKMRPIVCPSANFRYQLNLFQRMGFKVSGRSAAHREYKKWKKVQQKRLVDKERRMKEFQNRLESAFDCAVGQKRLRCVVV